MAYKNLEKFKRTRREYCRRLYVKDKARWYNIFKKYGLTKEDWQRILQDQGGVCAICGRDEKQIHKGRLKYLCVDHCHETGQLRGLVCGWCNYHIIAAADRYPGLASRLNKYLTTKKNYGFIPKKET